MGNIKKICIIAMIAMVVVSFTNLFGISAAGISVCLGVVFFFVNKAMEKQDFAGSGLDFKAIGTNLKEKSIWFWIAMPLMMDVLSMLLSKLFLPEYIDHVFARTEIFVSIHPKLPKELDNKLDIFSNGIQDEFIFSAGTICYRI